MQTPVEVLSLEQVERLLAQPNREDALGLRDAAVLATLYYAAATAVEVACLDVADVHMRREVMMLRGEDGVRRRVAMPAPLLEVLRDYTSGPRRLALVQSGEEGEPALFLANRPQRIRVQDIRQIVGANLKAAGILHAHVNLNTLRLSRAWHLREQGTSPEAIQRFLGAAGRSGRRVI